MKFILLYDFTRLRSFLPIRYSSTPHLSSSNAFNENQRSLFQRIFSLLRYLRLTISTSPIRSDWYLDQFDRNPDAIESVRFLSLNFFLIVFTYSLIIFYRILFFLPFLFVCIFLFFFTLDWKLLLDFIYLSRRMQSSFINLRIIQTNVHSDQSKSFNKKLIEKKKMPIDIYIYMYVGKCKISSNRFKMYRDRFSSAVIVLVYLPRLFPRPSHLSPRHPTFNPSLPN